MIVRRLVFFGLLFLIILLIFPGRQLFWLMRSRQTTGVFYMQYNGNALEQFRSVFSEIYFMVGTDTVWFKEPGRLKLKPGATLPVRYLPHDRSDAKVVNFRTFWGSSIVYGGIFFATLLAIFLHPGIVPRNARLRLGFRKPFIEIL